MLPDATEVSAAELRVRLQADESSGNIFELFAGLVEAAVQTEAENGSCVARRHPADDAREHLRPVAS
jgi:hypothetical protein